MNLKRVYLSKDEDTYVVTSGVKFLGVFNNEAVYEMEPYRGEHEGIFCRKFRRDASDKREGEFVSINSHGDATTVQTRPWWTMHRIVTINEKERTRFIGHIKVTDIAADGPQIELSKEWYTTSICFDSERAAFKYPGWTPYKIAEGYFAYVDHH